MSTSFYIEVAFVVLLGFQAVILLSTLNNKGIGFSFPDLAALVVCLSTGGGLLLCLSLDVRLGEMPDYQNIPTDVRVKGFASVFLYIWGIMLAKSLYFTRARLGSASSQSPVNPGFSVLKKLDWISPWSVFLFIGLVWLPRLIKISMGGGVSGFGGAHIGMNMPYPIVVMEHLFRAGAYGVIMFGIHKAFFSSKRAYIFLLPVAVELMFLVLQGRRQLIFAFFAIFFVVLGNSKRIRASNFIFFGIFASFFLMNFSTVFLSIRNSAQTVQRSSFDKVSAVEAVRTALSEQDGSKEEQEEAENKSLQNLQIRPRLPIMWIFQIVEGQKRYSPMWGESTFAAFMGALPRAVRPPKYWWDHASFVQRHYRQKHVDVGDNLVALGVSDFGLIGGFIWGFIFGWFLCVMNRFANRSLRENTVVALTIYAICFDACINFEASAVMPFTVLRNCMLLLILYVVSREFFSATTNVGGGTKPPRVPAKTARPHYG